MQTSIKAVLLLAVFIATNASAAQNYTNVTIKDVIVNMNTGIHFRINEKMINSENCGSSKWFKIESGSTYEKSALSLLLAYEAQKS
ncbi:hypothetical protein HQQ94_11390 [Shewanella sp. VB17]|uniref:hypothetical protein n=1 Tax=Shewanella sp. VB17 TaxID=2739432 RepID=UPI001565700E|nr:hypothetical protein [Shewanella sp. VB17]NRD73830.1 hypothetical protein [Shewanella sp. VB17]